MSRLNPRVTVNVLTVLAVSVLVVIGAFLSYVSGVLFDDSYEVSVPMPEGGGVQPLQEVTVLGRAVGQVDDVEIVEDGVLLTLSIDGDRRVPDEADVQVLRRSPIGEQAVDFQPLASGWSAAEPGGTVVPREATVPAPVPFLLEETVDLFEAIEPDDVSVLVHELSNALGGRGERLRNLNRDTLELNRTLVGGIPTFERLLDTSEPVLETLREHRDALASSFGSGADLAEVFADQRGNVDDLLDSAPRALDETDVLVRNVRADLACLTRDMTALNEMLLGPSTYRGENPDLYDSKLDELERMLVSNRYFFDLGFNIISQPDPLTGLSWTRVLLVLDQEETAEFYDGFRATPAVLPAEACETEAWGRGVNAARQSDPVEAHHTSPGIDYAPLLDEPREHAVPRHDVSDASSPESADETAGAPSAPTREEDRRDAPSTPDDGAEDEAAALDVDRDRGGLASTGGEVVDLLAVAVPAVVIGAVALLTWRRRTHT